MCSGFQSTLDRLHHVGHGVVWNAITLRRWLLAFWALAVVRRLAPPQVFRDAVAAERVRTSRERRWIVVQVQTDGTLDCIQLRQPVCKRLLRRRHCAVELSVGTTTALSGRDNEHGEDGEELDTSTRAALAISAYA